MKIKPCPFCGDEIKIVEHRDSIHSKTYYDIIHAYTEENQCPIGTHEGEPLGSCYYDNKDEVIKNINRRYSSEAADAET